MGSSFPSISLFDAALPGNAPDAVGRITVAAVEVELIRPGEPLDRRVMKLCMRVVDMAAKIGDRYTTGPTTEDTVGNYIRAELYD